MQKTDIGMIPADWELRPLSELGEPKIGLTYSPADVRESGTLVLRSSNVQNDRLAFDDNVYVRSEIAGGSHVEPGDILICVRNGSRALIGKCALIDESAKGMAFGAFMSVFRSPHSALLFQQFRSDIIGRQIAEHLGATINQITNGSLKSFRVPFPPDDEERRRIAQALSVFDDLIASLDALIAKKLDIKQGAMQQLLTGKRRLPGFSGEWPLSKIGGIFDILRNGSHARAAFQDDGEVYCAHYGAIHGTSRSHVTPRTFPRLKESFASGLPLAQDGDLLLADASEDLDGIGKSVELMNCGAHRIVAGLHTILLRPKPKAVAPGYAGYLQFKPEFKSGLIRISNGISVYGISKGSLREIEIKLPSYDEQAQIAQFLITLQSEIAHQEYKRAKLYALRHGMMQQLITGRIRLK